MDSLSQLALGAAVGEVTLGQKVGNRALLFGAAVATLPDLDVLFYPLMDEVAQLGWHRGISHSLLFNLAFAPALGWVLYRINGRRASFGDWTALAVACLLTAVLLDCFTVYGTQVFQPFSNYQVGFNNISIIDPLYTVPLLAAVVVVAFVRRSLPARKAVIMMGLGLSTAYMAATIVIKFYVESVVENALTEQHYEYDRLMTAPTLFNAVLWRATAEVPGGYQVGYYSLFDTRSDIAFSYVPRNEWLLNGIRDSRAVRQLLWFSDGWYTVREASDGFPVFSDLRFGAIHTNSESEGQYIFNWKLVTDESGTHLERVNSEIEDAGRAMRFLWDRIRGH